MTERKQEQAEAGKQTQAIELEDAKLEQATGGGYFDGEAGRTGGTTVKGIKDGTSN